MHIFQQINLAFVAVLFFVKFARWRHRGFNSYSGQNLRNNLGQVVHIYVPLSPSNITWYRPRGGDALQLGR